MAEATFSEDQFCCSICLDLLKDPVAIPCGHSYCMSCITGCWDQDDDKGVYNCPQCRQTFTPRPVLGKNTILAEMVEKLKKMNAVPPECCAERGDVQCNVCTGRKYKAVKSCLTCLNSYCQNHLEQHEHFFKGKRHYLMDATGHMDELICCEHDRPLEVFCRTDQLCICLMCVMDKHKNHDTETASAERIEKQRQLGKIQRQFKERIKEREEKLQELRDAVKSHKCFAQAAVEDSERIFTEFIHFIERSRSEVTQLIRDQEKAAVSRAEGFMKQLEQGIADLRRRNAELEQLPHTNEDIHFLQSFQSLSVLPESADLDNMTISSQLSFDGLTKGISLLRGKVEDFCKEEIDMISQKVRYVEIIPTSEPKTRQEFLQSLSLDEMEMKSTAIIKKYLYINDLKEAVQCVQDLNSSSLLFVFVRNGVKYTLEHSTIAREHIGLLFQKLVGAGILPPEQFYKGLQKILEIADVIEIPHIWLAEIITPMLQEEGIPMGQLFREVSKPLLPKGKAAVLLVEILNLLCKGLSHKKAGLMWLEAGLSWKDFLPEDEDVNKFVTEKKMEFTLDEESEKPSKKELTADELSKHLDRLLQDKANNQRIYDWVEANLDELQISSNQFVRALMTSVCQSAIICENPYKVDVKQITQRARLLQKYLSDESKELQALYALQALMVQMEQPANLLRMFFDALYDEDVIKVEAFYKWESSKDPAEQLGKGVALKSVSAFFIWLWDTEDFSDSS